MSPLIDGKVHKTIVRQIERYMADTGHRQYEIAAMIGAPVQTVNRWINGKAKVSPVYHRTLIEKKIVKAS